ncbi:TPA: hypothetical protein PXJ30_002167 [Yersinia enterocolitica]|uniref:hypothetical protein n=1 Tax=Yersinia enterocolitica TaxID=630 RepID=UPI00065A8C4A|nr:hypothetical protein [Yersinia enterocolitica]CRX93156.1 Uncharacterised protein [Yersinia enterocolitica]HDL6647132.1 hypothetical protein [Yersinia enterocolitica]HDL7145394.1 hypothetical protein [Yersinia enterocolitica]HDL7370490.1 hypothetical protein [Yersinia enterocolitica]HDL8132550.1 hypothetical protein [Yersinia enterocolitica]
MDIDFFFPDHFEFDGESYRGQRVAKKNEIIILIASKDCPFDINNVITQKVGNKERLFKVIDWEVQDSLGVGGKPYLATLSVEALDVPEKKHAASQTINFNAAVNAGNLQAGNNNTIYQTITIEQLADAIAASKDPDAQALWQKLLNNNTVAGILSAATGVLLTL